MQVLKEKKLKILFKKNVVLHKYFSSYFKMF